VALVVVALLLVASCDGLLESWHLWRFDTLGLGVQRDSIRFLSENGSVRSCRKLLDLLEDEDLGAEAAAGLISLASRLGCVGRRVAVRGPPDGGRRSCCAGNRI
jgi:hypothetical protein